MGGCARRRACRQRCSRLLVPADSRCVACVGAGGCQAAFLPCPVPAQRVERQAPALLQPVRQPRIAGCCCAAPRAAGVLSCALHVLRAQSRPMGRAFWREVASARPVLLPQSWLGAQVGFTIGLRVCLSRNSSNGRSSGSCCTCLQRAGSPAASVAAGRHVGADGRLTATTRWRHCCLDNPRCLLCRRPHEDDARMHAVGLAVAGDARAPRSCSLLSRRAVHACTLPHCNAARPARTTHLPPCAHGAMRDAHARGVASKCLRTERLAACLCEQVWRHTRARQSRRRRRRRLRAVSCVFCPAARCSPPHRRPKKDSAVARRASCAPARQRKTAAARAAQRQQQAQAVVHSGQAC